MKKPYIPILLGTAREERFSEKVATYVLGIARSFPFETELVDVRDHAQGYTIPAWVDHPNAKVWRSIAQRADGFIFVFPEYNHSYPGEMKMVLDMALHEYAAKPVLFCSVSEGGFGGVRAIEHMLSFTWNAKMITIPGAITVTNVQDTFMKSKEEIDATYKGKVEKAIQTLLLYTEELAQLREKIAK
ncbi:MAG TPA: NAD(P)H-dependent oxidoreductase [Candidatus Kapabacteria bacterium]|nr:NAD(P)H-dependent oxidoreductase [Candidatus Kapabacteria bacterium]